MTPQVAAPPTHGSLTHQPRRGALRPSMRMRSRLHHGHRNVARGTAHTKPVSSGCLPLAWQSGPPGTQRGQGLLSCFPQAEADGRSTDGTTTTTKPGGGEGRCGFPSAGTYPGTLGLLPWPCRCPAKGWGCFGTGTGEILTEHTWPQGTSSPGLLWSADLLGVGVGGRVRGQGGLAMLWDKDREEQASYGWSEEGPAGMLS